MEGSKLVPAFMAGVVVMGGVFWTVGLATKANVTAEAEAHGLRELSRMELAERVAREDMFGLPSRLPNAPEREIERAYHEGTAEHPFPASTEGVATLLDVYHVTVKGCRGLLPPDLREQEAIAAWVNISTVDGRGRVSEVEGMGMGEGQAERAFTNCVLGGLQGAVFEAPEGGEKAFPARLTYGS